MASMNRGHVHDPKLSGVVVGSEAEVKYDIMGTVDYNFIRLFYEDGRAITFYGGDHGNEDPWVFFTEDRLE